jgi:hypothetical protein
MKKLVWVFGFLVSGLSYAQDLSPLECNQTRAGCPDEVLEKVESVDHEISEYLFKKLPLAYHLHPSADFSRNQISKTVNGIAVYDKVSEKYLILSCEDYPLMHVMFYSCAITEKQAPGEFSVVSSPSGILDLLKVKIQ